MLLRGGEGRARLAQGGSDHLRVDAPISSVLLDWSHWATAQGAQRELAARWAWDRRGRAALGLWRQRLVQQREVELRARERGRRLQRRALGHWHCYWQSESGAGTGHQG